MSRFSVIPQPDPNFDLAPCENSRGLAWSQFDVWTRLRYKIAAAIICYSSLTSLVLATNISTDVTDNLELRMQIQQADDLFDASLFVEAAPIYRIIFNTLENNPSALQLEHSLVNKIQCRIRYRLAQALFNLKDYKTAVELLQNDHTYSDQQFLLATAYRNNGENDQAILLLQNYLDDSCPSTEKHLDQAHFELALAFFFKGDITNAQISFKKTLDISQNNRLKILANFYLVRIMLTQYQIDEAEVFLKQAEHLLKDDDLLKYESLFLQGLVNYNKHDFAKASDFLKKALPKQNPSHVKWFEDTYYFLSQCYLKQADNPLIQSKKQLEYLDQALEVLTRLEDLAPNERTWMTQGEYYLILGKRLNDDKALKKAEEIFSDPNKIQSPQMQNQAVLFKAQAHLSYAERDRRFRQLTQSSKDNKSFIAQAWYLRGLNDFEEAQLLKQTQKCEEADKIFERAAISLEKVSENAPSPTINSEALLLLARCYEAKAIGKDSQKALASLSKLWEQDNKYLRHLPDPLEAFLLYGNLAAHASNETIHQAVVKLQQGIHTFPTSPGLLQTLHLLGMLYYQLDDFFAAEEIFQQIANDWPQSNLAPEALFRASQCAEKQKKDPSIIRAYKQQILSQYPSSAIAPEAYFTFFSYQDYLQADRHAIKHLNAFPDLYPDSPYVLNAYFLIGLDNKRDRRSPEGKWLRKKNLTAAIDHFQEVETHFEVLDSKEKILPKDKEHYLLLRYRSQLEKGLSNFILANESIGAKRQIYLEYSQEALEQLLHELRSDTNIYRTWMINSDPFWHLEEECAHWLSQVYLTSQDLPEAEKVLSHMLEKYDTAKITRGYFLSRTWSTKGTMALDRLDYDQALQYFLKAEDAAKGKVLSSDQRLNLLIQQSRCWKELNQPEKAILTLSKVINDDAVSNLRIKAMFLRAEIYEKQQRFELARKQLEATSKKGGEWSLKAKEKLEKDYGYR